MKIINVEQGTPEWQELRIERISGTRLCSAIGTPAKQETLINELIAERLTLKKKEVYVSMAMAKGTEAEDYAIEEYELKTGELTEKVGLCVSDEFEWLVNSPDRLIKIDGKYRKAVEVKCPNADTHIKYIRASDIPDEYEAQVMSYFLVNGDLEELDFVSYCPDISTEQYRLMIANIRREDLPLEKAKEDLLKFYSKYESELKRLNLSL